MAKADIDFEKELWDAANKLRGAVSESNYKNYILPLVFVKHLSERYEVMREELKADYIIANPPFNVSNWHPEDLPEGYPGLFGNREEFTTDGSANYMWIQTFCTPKRNGNRRDRKIN
ncbi:type I restriction-modification system subunit M N-terminal domain-containing protein [Salegentibacter agarivorans]|jgi:type I restriction-modification system DNA methylase subunit